MTSSDKPGASESTSGEPISGETQLLAADALSGALQALMHPATQPGASGGMLEAGCVGVGVDVVAIARIEAALQRHPQRFARRILVHAEWARFESLMASGADPHRYLAKQFAAKESVAKALGTGIAQGVTFHQLQILRDTLGAPYVELTGIAARRCQWLGGRAVRVSITDEAQWAIAVALIAP